MSNEETFETESMDLWRVRLPAGDTRLVTLEQLDELFQAAEIDESTPVQEEGAEEWSTLGAVAGLDETPPSTHEMPPPPPAPGPTSANMAMAVPTSVGSLRAVPVAEALSSPPPPVVASVPVGALDLDDLDPSFRGGGKKKWAVFALAAAALIGGAFVVARSGITAGDAGAAVNANAGASLANAPVAAQAPPPESELPKPQLTEEQKKALLDADKARAAKVHTNNEKSAPPRRAPKSADPFHKSKNKYDPLNGAL